MRTRKVGIGLALAFGLLMTGPVMADQSTQSALSTIDKANTTLTGLQQLIAQINQRQTSAVAVNDSAEPLKCPACGMMMPTKARGNLTRAVKYGGKTYYCCAGCDMSATQDK